MLDVKKCAVAFEKARVMSKNRRNKYVGLRESLMSLVVESNDQDQFEERWFYLIKNRVPYYYFAERKYVDGRTLVRGLEARGAYDSYDSWEEI